MGQTFTSFLIAVICLDLYNIFVHLDFFQYLSLCPFQCLF